MKNGPKVTYRNLNTRVNIIRKYTDDFDVVGILEIEVDLNFCNEFGLLIGSVTWVDGECPYDIGEEVNISEEEYERAISIWEDINDRDWD